MTSNKQQRVVLFVVVCVVALVASIVVVRHGNGSSDREATHEDAPVETVDVDPHEDAGVTDPAASFTYLDAGSPAATRLLAEPHFLSVRYPHMSGEKYRVEVVSVDRPKGPRLRTALSCVKVHQRAGVGICVAPPSDPLGVTVRFFDATFAVTSEVVLAGTPSRARMSPGGRRGVVTNFLSGHSYADTKFTTATTIFDLSDGSMTNLEKWTTYNGDREVTEASRNFWGVSFIDDDHFYASMGIRGDRYLLRGDVATRTMRVVGTHMECPSVAPDGKHLTFRRSVVDQDGTAAMPLFLLDLTTMKERRLTYWDTVDGQPEWLDDHRILIGTPSGPPNVAVVDISANHQQGETPEILVPDALAVSFDFGRSITSGDVATSTSG